MFDISILQLVILLIALCIPVIPNLWAIWHAFHCDFQNPYEKMVWLLLSVFLPFIGGLLYLIWGRKRGVRTL